MKNNFRIGAHYDETFSEMHIDEIEENLNAVAYNVTETEYVRNLDSSELAERKNQYSEMGIILSEIAEKKKEALEKFKAIEKEPRETAKVLLEAIKEKAEKRYGKLYLVDEQLTGMMYLFDSTGVCVDARPLEKTERQTKIKSLRNE